jgi:hypothetical protein
MEAAAIRKTTTLGLRKAHWLFTQTSHIEAGAFTH